jgi:hypothetical protein
VRRAISEYAKTPKQFSYERWDCSVRALRVAAGLSYEQAHATLGRFTRRPRYGVQAIVMFYACGAHGLPPVEFGTTGYLRARPLPTLTQFLKAHPTGYYVLMRSGHFFAVINGVVHDWAHGTGARSRITHAWGTQS